MRLPDTARVEIVGGPTLDNFTSFEITNDMMVPSEAAFELGNAGTWGQISDRVAHGTQYRVIVNDRLRLTGRVELNDAPLDAAGGSVVRFTVRTKLADAMYAGASPGVIQKNMTLKDLLLSLYAPLGYTASDFIGDDQALGRNLLTGRDTTGQSPGPDFKKVNAQKAKVQPGETIYGAADRHLRRHGLIHWDSPDGKILVGAPNDTQAPIYTLRANRGPAGQGNNVRGITRGQDWSGIPSSIQMTGIQVPKGRGRKRVSQMARVRDVSDAGFYRPIVMQAEGVRSVEEARIAIKRELAARSKGKDAITVELDGLSWWDGYRNVNWGVDCVVAVESDVLGGTLGAYFVHGVTLRRDPAGGDATNLSLLKKGIWVLS